MALSEKRLRHYAARALARIGPPAKAALPTLGTLLKDESSTRGNGTRGEFKSGTIRFDPYPILLPGKSKTYTFSLEAVAAGSAKLTAKVYVKDASGKRVLIEEDEETTEISPKP